MAYGVEGILTFTAVNKSSIPIILVMLVLFDMMWIDCL